MTSAIPGLGTYERVENRNTVQIARKIAQLKELQIA